MRMLSRARRSQLGVVGIEKEAAILEHAIKSEAADSAIAALLKNTEARCGVIWASIRSIGRQRRLHNLRL